MQNDCGCHPFLNCECGELLCYHTVSFHVMRGHSLRVSSQIEMINSFSKLLKEVSDCKAEILERSIYLISQVEKLTLAQINQLGSFKKRIKESVSESFKITQKDYDQASNDLKNLKNSQNKDLDRVQELLIGMNTLVISGSQDKSIRLWKQEQEVQVIHGDAGCIWSIAVPESKKFIVSGSADYTVRVWDLKSGQETKVLTGNTEEVLSVAVSHNEDFVVSGSRDKTVRVWDLASGRQTQVFAGHGNSVYSVAISSKDEFLVSGSYDKTIRVWNLSSRKLTKYWKGIVTASTQ